MARRLLQSFREESGVAGLTWQLGGEEKQFEERLSVIGQASLLNGCGERMKESRTNHWMDGAAICRGGDSRFIQGT